MVIAIDPLIFTQGIVISTGEHSKFGEVFKMMQAEEVSILALLYCAEHYFEIFY